MIARPPEQGFLKLMPLGMLDGTAGSLDKTRRHGGEDEGIDEVS